MKVFANREIRNLFQAGNLNVPQLYEMEKVSEQENVAEKYPEKVFELQTILRQVRNKRIKM